MDADAELVARTLAGDREAFGRLYDRDARLVRAVASECGAAALGFAHMNTIQRHNPDAAYHGKTVGPDDKDRVLFRWKQPDGDYRVIYGDLRAETVTAERLKELEKR